jgi:methionine sulfoxide reductase heme-binding subunit
VKGDPTYWVLARATGFTAYALLTASVLAGLTVKGRRFGKALRAAAVTDMHGFLALLGLGAIAVHGTALVFDSLVTITPLDLVVPGRVDYRPLWTGAGIVSAELMLLVYVSFYIRRRIGTSTWRKLHWLTYAVFALATAHGIMAGTDAPKTWATAVYVGAVGFVATATGWRVLARPAREAARPAAAAATASAVSDTLVTSVPTFRRMLTHTLLAVTVIAAGAVAVIFINVGLLDYASSSVGNLNPQAASRAGAAPKVEPRHAAAIHRKAQNRPAKHRLRQARIGAAARAPAEAAQVASGSTASTTTRSAPTTGAAAKPAPATPTTRSTPTRKASPSGGSAHPRDRSREHEREHEHEDD